MVVSIVRFYLTYVLSIHAVQWLTQHVQLKLSTSVMANMQQTFCALVLKGKKYIKSMYLDHHLRFTCHIVILLGKAVLLPYLSGLINV